MAAVAPWVDTNPAEIPQAASDRGQASLKGNQTRGGGGNWWRRSGEAEVMPDAAEAAEEERWRRIGRQEERSMRYSMTPK